MILCDSIKHYLFLFCLAFSSSRILNIIHTDFLHWKVCSLLRLLFALPGLLRVLQCFLPACQGWPSIHPAWIWGSHRFSKTTCLFRSRPFHPHLSKTNDCRPLFSSAVLYYVFQGWKKRKDQCFSFKMWQSYFLLAEWYQRFFPGLLVILDGLVLPRRSSLIDFSTLHKSNLFTIFPDTSGDILRQPVCFFF